MKDDEGLLSAGTRFAAMIVGLALGKRTFRDTSERTWRGTGASTSTSMTLDKYSA
jgi:hypothetical protein